MNEEKRSEKYQLGTSEKGRSYKVSRGTHSFPQVPQAHK